LGTATFGQPANNSGVGFANPAGVSQPDGKSTSSSEPVSGSTSNFRHSLFDDPNKFDTTNSGTQTPPLTHTSTPSMPLPPVQHSARSTVPSANAIRLKSAIASMRTGNYTESLTILNKIIADNPKHAEAYYVRAVVHVFMRNFKDAKADYEAAIRYSTDPALTERAAAGISKLSH
jgi:tetratricopeptide (TPR) repeat protein